MKFARIGMRTAKTVIAVVLTLAIAEIFKLRSPLLASIAAIMTMESSISESFSTGANRMYGTILGGIVGLLANLIAPGNFFFLAIGLIIIINVCNTFKWEKAARISMVVFLSIVLNYKVDDGLSYAAHRILDTLIGVVIGTAINYFIRPPKLDEKIRNAAEKMLKTIEIILERSIWKQEYQDLEGLKEEIDNIKNDYKILVEDLKFYVGKATNTSIYRNLFSSFEKLHSHMAVIPEIKEDPFIEDANRQVIEDHYQKPILSQEGIKRDDLDIIYNYHLQLLLNEFMAIKGLIYKTHKSSDGS